ncbi:hypothetical protein Patl1_01059 [Pistacia atlantica]|uniref:Uncharacterized protein n=1 Tax=Pistacia atlantica TaxID=434234 RepID=A0ACC1C7A5_9ROSI|nr:hypothetical protein Patl1_01059 [Pistacia atlantica]
MCECAAELIMILSNKQRLRQLWLDQNVNSAIEVAVSGPVLQLL